MLEMYISRKIVKRGKVKIKLTPEEIKKAAEIYKKSCESEEIARDKNIKNKLKLWIKNIEKEKDINKVISNFEELFKYDCEPICFQEVGDFFEQYSEIFELNENVVIEKSWGAWDKFGNKVSHKGTDINVYFKTSEKEENRKGITIFFEDQYQNNIEKLKNMIEEEIKDEVNI